MVIQLLTLKNYLSNLFIYIYREMKCIWARYDICKDMYQ